MARGPCCGTQFTAGKGKSLMTSEKNAPTTEDEMVSVRKREFVMNEKLSHLPPMRQARAKVILNRVRSSGRVALNHKFFDDCNFMLSLTKKHVEMAINDLCEAGLTTHFVDGPFMELRVNKDYSDAPT